MKLFSLLAITFATVVSHAFPSHLGGTPPAPEQMAVLTIKQVSVTSRDTKDHEVEFLFAPVFQSIRLSGGYAIGTLQHDYQDQLEEGAIVTINNRVPSNTFQLAVPLRSMDGKTGDVQVIMTAVIDPTWWGLRNSGTNTFSFAIEQLSETKPFPFKMTGHGITIEGEAHLVRMP